MLRSPFSWGGLPKPLISTAPRRSMAATSSRESSARQPWNCSGSLPVSAAPSRPILRRFASSNPSGRGGAFPSTNRFTKGLRPSRRQGSPQVSLRCNLGDSPPLTAHTPTLAAWQGFMLFCMTPLLRRGARRKAVDYRGRGVWVVGRCETPARWHLRAPGSGLVGIPL